MSTRVEIDGAWSTLTGAEELRFLMDTLGMSEADARQYQAINAGRIPGDVLTTEQLRRIAPAEVERHIPMD